MNRTNLLALLILISAACTQQEKEQEEETTSSEMMLTSIVTTDLDTAMVEPIDSVEDEEELPREIIVAEEEGTYHFTLVPDKEKDGMARYQIRRFQSLPNATYEKGKEGMVLKLPRENGPPIRFRIPRALSE